MTIPRPVPGPPVPGTSDGTTTEPAESDTQYDVSAPQENIIFWDTPPTPRRSIPQKLRTLLWFYPDFLAILMYRLRPVSYVFLYAFIFFLGWKTITYAQQNPESIINTPTPQIMQEAAVGIVSSLNPLFVTQNQLERDLQSLIFSKLITIGPDGNTRPDLATTWAVSKDGKEYTFFLRKGVTWHDGVSFTADDVVYTLETIQKLGSEDSYAKEFENVSFSKIGDYTVIITLPETNPTLIDSLALYIVPEHILGSVSTSAIKIARFNTAPIGTGPFIFDSKTNNQIRLVRNDDYYKGPPVLEGITYTFFPTEEDAVESLKQFELHTLSQPTGSAVNELKEYPAFNTYSFPLQLRQKIVFFNLRSTGPLSSTAVRQALSFATDRALLLAGLPTGGTPVDGPVNSNSWAYAPDAEHYPLDIARAKELLSQDGWTQPEAQDDSSAYLQKDSIRLEFTLTFLDNPSNKIIAESLKSQWAQIGVSVRLDPQSYDRISSETVPRRNFEALLFEIEHTSDPDQYNLWHSSQSDYPGLNLSGYSYDRVDIILERARREFDRASRASDYVLFQKYLMEDAPAIFLYQPSYIFIAHDSIGGIELSEATLPQHRYANIEEWYISK